MSEVLRDVVQKVFEKIVDNLDFVENINYIRESSETAVLEFSGINLQEIQVPDSYYNKVIGIYYNKILRLMVFC